MLSMKEIYTTYCSSFVGTILVNDLRLIKQNNPYRFYRCPCGSHDHLATRCIDNDDDIGDGFAVVLHCYENKLQWLVVTKEILLDETRHNKTTDNCPAWHSVRETIRGEEEKFFMLLEGADDKINQYMSKRKIGEITAEDLFVLHTTYGYDPSVVEQTVGNISTVLHDEYLLLMKQHKQISKRKKK